MCGCGGERWFKFRSPARVKKGGVKSPATEPFFMVGIKLQRPKVKNFFQFPKAFQGFQIWDPN